MHRNPILPVLFCLLAVGAVIAPPAHADAWDKKTVVTFSQSVEVPGMVLPAGEYVFKLVDSPADRHIVRIMNTRENHVFATILAIPSYRLITPEKTLFTFYEMPTGQPDALKEWFYPGDNYGQEFAYSKKRAAEIALAIKNKGMVVETQTMVAATSPAPAAPDTDDRKAAVTETTSESTAALATSPAAPAPEVTAETPSPSDEHAEPAQAPEPAPQAPSTPDTPDNALPKTASQLYLTGLLGLLATLVAFGVRQYRRAVL
jgi:hypothetical protein